MANDTTSSTTQSVGTDQLKAAATGQALHTNTGSSAVTSVTRGGGVIDIDGKPASSVRFVKGEGERRDTMELRFMHGRQLVQKVTVTDIDQLLDAVGETNATLIERDPASKGVLRGNHLSYVYGQSPAEVARWSEQNQQRAADAFARESVLRAAAMRTRERQDEPPNQIIDRTQRHRIVESEHPQKRDGESPVVAPRVHTLPQVETVQADADRTREALRKRYIEVGDRYHFRDKANEVAFEHSERVISTKHDHATVARDMVDLAASKGWNTIELKGSESFKREVWIQASLQGIAVASYPPRAVDVARFEELRAERERTRQRLNSHNADRERQSERLHANEFSRHEAPVDKTVAPAKIESPQRPLRAAEREAVTALQELMRERGDSDKAIAMASIMAAERFQIPRTYVGTVVEHGAAPYQHAKEAKPSYYITINTREGKTVVWGKELVGAIADSNTQPGQLIALENLGKVPVTVIEKRKDLSGKVIESRELGTNRNQWRITPMENIRAEARQHFEHNDWRRTHQPQVNGRASAREAQPGQNKTDDQSQGLER